MKSHSLHLRCHLEDTVHSGWYILNSAIVDIGGGSEGDIVRIEGESVCTVGY